jgi:hypothetical protein
MQADLKLQRLVPELSIEVTKLDAKWHDAEKREDAQDTSAFATK